MRDRTRYVVAVVVGLTGFVWFLQGLGAPIGGSFMVGDPFWAYAGALVVAVSIAYGAWPRLRHR